jgi:hypothetical protein
MMITRQAFNESKLTGQWNSTFYYIFIDYRVYHIKVLRCIMPVDSIYNKNFVPWNKLCFWKLQIGSNKKKSINWHYFCFEKIVLITFSELPPKGFCLYCKKMCCSLVQKHHGSVESFYVSNALPLNAVLVNFTQFKATELFWVSLA